LGFAEVLGSSQIQNPFQPHHKHKGTLTVLQISTISSHCLASLATCMDGWM